MRCKDQKLLLIQALCTVEEKLCSRLSILSLGTTSKASNGLVIWIQIRATAVYSGVPNRSAALNSSATRNGHQKLIIVPPLIEVPLGKSQVYRYEFKKIWL